MNTKPMIVDAHYDLLMDVTRLRNSGETQVIEKFFLNDLKVAGVNVLICSLFISSEFIPEMALRVALKQIANLYAEMRESPGMFALCRTADEARKAVAEDKIAMFLSFEGVDPLGQDLQLLQVFYELGVRLVGLSWSRRNFAADGCLFHPLEQGQEGGLTAFGVSLLKEIHRLGMIVDISHLNDTGTDEVFRFTAPGAPLEGLPVIASHSDCRALCPVARNLTDDQLRTLADRGGVTGLNAMARFVQHEAKGGADADGNCDYTGLLEHAQHVIDLVGPDHVGLGLDLCEFHKPLELRNGGIFPTYCHVRPFIDAIRQKFAPDVATKILCENWMRVLTKL